MGRQTASGERPLLEGLRDPAAYPHPVGAIEVRETHISWIVLTGPCAYKIKKPVKLSFLDFSTLERRHHFCVEELRLNRRFAPSLYLDVVPITGTADAPRIEGDGEPFEFAVKLKQFSPRDEMSALLLDREVWPEDVVRLGKRLAAVHACAAVARPDEEWGDIPQLTRVARGNMAELRSLLRRDDDHGRLDELASWSEGRLNRLAELVHQRRMAGRVREGHGDLHVGNVVRIDRDLTPFDCLEFDPTLRWVDVLDDTAFLFMDLRARRERQLAYVFMNAWLEATGDYAGLPLLPFFAAQRALVRAKVALLSARNELALVPSAAGPTAPRASTYLALAESLASHRRPSLILTCGRSGSGKTWLTGQLVGVLPALRIRSDVERKRLAGIDPLQASRSGVSEGIYTTEFTQRTYATLLDGARKGLECGENMIVDAAFLKWDERQRFRQLAAESGASFVLLVCEAPESVLRARVAARTEARDDASEATLEVLDMQRDHWEPPAEDEADAAVTIDTSAPEAVEFARFRLMARLAG